MFLLYIVSLRLFCAFIDSVQRGLLVEKPLNSGVNGKVLNLIRDTYAKAKSCVKTGHVLLQIFVSNVCLRQRGEFVVSFVFAVFERFPYE